MINDDFLDIRLKVAKIQIKNLKRNVDTTSKLNLPRM